MRMKVYFKTFTFITITIAIGFGIWIWLLTSGAFDISIKELRSKYETSESKYINLDGVEIHYIDEGTGDPIVLTHASYHSSLAWNGVAERLKNNFRVIRFDFPNAGLSGLDSKNRYSVEHYQQLISQLSEALGIEKFHLIGTSSGGTVAFRYAANNPEKINRFVLVNSAGMPRTAVTNPNRARGTAFERWVLTYHQSRNYWESALSRTVTSRPPSDDHIDMNFDMNNREGRRIPAMTFMKNYVTGNPEAMLKKIKSPTLILWGMDNPTVMHLEANVIQHWITGAPSLVIKYDGLGHYPYIEEPELLANDINKFLIGELDDQLLQTTRLKISDIEKLNLN